MKNTDLFPLGNKSLTTIFLIFVSIMFFPGCSAKVLQIYSGPKKPASEVSFLTGINPNYLLKVDGKLGPYGKVKGYKYPWGDRFAVELEPGIHELVVKYRFSDLVDLRSTSVGIETTMGFAQSGPYELSFVFEPGKIYELGLNDQEKSSWIYEIDKIPCRICRK